MLKLSLFVLLSIFAFQANAIELKAIFNDSSRDIQAILAVSKPKSLVTAIASPDIKNFKLISSSRKAIKSFFYPPKVLHSTVHFWFYIFSSLTSDSVAFHDKESGMLYKAYDFSNLHNKISDPHLAHYLQNKLSLDLAIQYCKSSFKNQTCNLRIQTGQHDIFIHALENFEIYKSSITHYLKLFKAPIEFLAIPFLESHFDTSALSRSGAYGLWQFMRPIADFFMPNGSDIDYRESPYLSTIAAIHLLKQNKMILKNWPLAILAYNTGVTEIRYEKKKLRRVNLQSLILDSKNPHFGFAAKNYYSEFYAILLLLWQKNLLDYEGGKDIFLPYITHCNASVTLNLTHNPHLKSFDGTLPLKTILFLPETSKIKSKCLEKVVTKDLRKKYPKDWL